jgi:hypothetical protein
VIDYRMNQRDGKVISVGPGAGTWKVRDSSVMLHVSPHALHFSQPLEISFTVFDSEDIQGTLVRKSDKAPCPPCRKPSHLPGDANNV